MGKITSVEGYIEKHEKFAEALTQLRQIMLSTTMDETLKWGAPVYTVDGKNTVGLGAFKNHFGIWFFNGVFLKDEKNVLEQAQEKTKALRQMRFTKLADIDVNLVLAYVKEAIENQKLGKQLKPEKKGRTVEVPELLKAALKQEKNLLQSFNALTPGKQREYCDYITSAKREATKHSRLDKIKPLILQGCGLYDKYKNC
ncbi:MAG: hypothetical protein GYB39_08260 [Algicola sp.]|nr:hypothetical protein [Algicola sp.]